MDASPPTAWRSRLGGASERPVADVGFTVAVFCVAAVALWIEGADAGSSAATAVLVAGVGACGLVARRFPVVATLLVGPLLFASQFVPEPAQDVGDGVLLIAVFPVVYRLASRSTIGVALAGTVVVAACWQGGALWHTGIEAINPSFAFSTIGPCVVGVLVGSRRRMRAQLEAQAQALKRAQESYAAEAVRYERTRIARELHDIVAHCVSAMVVQANAGRRLSARNPLLAAEAFHNIEASAQHAATEVDRLVTMLEPNAVTRPPPIEDLIARIRALGLAVDYRLTGLDSDNLAVSDTAFAVVQESLTNALKHAPGAAIDVVVQVSPRGTRVVVSNAPARAVTLELAGTGGGHGLAGLRERLAACGGTLAADATHEGGWRVAADVPTAGAQPS